MSFHFISCFKIVEILFKGCVILKIGSIIIGKVGITVEIENVYATPIFDKIDFVIHNITKNNNYKTFNI